MEEKEFQASVQIADDVVKNIAILSASDVRGVAAIAGVASEDARTASPGQYSFKGVKATLTEDDVKVTIPITVDYGTSLPKAAATVQQRVADTIENMTGLSVSEVHVSVTGVRIP